MIGAGTDASAESGSSSGGLLRGNSRRHSSLHSTAGPAVQFPASLSIPAWFRAGTCKTGFSEGGMQHLADMAPLSTKQGN